MKTIQRFFALMGSLRRKLSDSYAVMADKVSALDLRRKLGLVIIAGGLCVVVYGFVIPVYNNYLNQRRLETFREALSMLDDDYGPAGGGSGDGQGVAGLTEEQMSQMTEQQRQQIADQNKVERMAKLRNFLQEQGENIIGILTVESLNWEYAIVEGTEAVNIRSAVGHLTETEPLGGDGNCVLAGHRGGMYGDFFDDLDKLEMGALVKVQDLSGAEYVYEAYSTKVVGPKDWSITDMVKGEKTLTLMTCENNGSKRLAVACKMIELTVDEKTGEEHRETVVTTTTPKPTPTPPPTPTPTPVPTPTPGPVRDMVITGKTNEQGGWSLNLPDGTYTITYTDDHGGVEQESITVGSGVTSRVQSIRVIDSAGMVVYQGQTAEDGSWSVTLVPGRYDVELTNVFGTVTKEERIVE